MQAIKLDSQQLINTKKIVKILLCNKKKKENELKLF